MIKGHEVAKGQSGKRRNEKEQDEKDHKWGSQCVASNVICSGCEWGPYLNLFLALWNYSSLFLFFCIFQNGECFFGEDNEYI